MIERNDRTIEFDTLAQMFSQTVAEGHQITFVVDLAQLHNVSVRWAERDGQADPERFAQSATAYFREHVEGAVEFTIGGLAQSALSAAVYQRDELPRDERRKILSDVAAGVRELVPAKVGGRRWQELDPTEFCARVEALRRFWKTAKKYHAQDRLEHELPLLLAEFHLSHESIAIARRIARRVRNAQPRDLAAEHAYEELHLHNSAGKVPSWETLLRQCRKKPRKSS